MGKRVATALLCAVTFACSEQTKAPAGVTRADSAGVTIVGNSAEAMSTAETWTIRSRPVLEVPNERWDGPSLFRVGDVVPLARHRLAVANQGSHEVLVVDSAGSVAFRMGREGAGPGEFRDITSMTVIPDDSLAVWDGTSFRLSVFDDNGSLGHETVLSDLLKVTNGSWATIHSLGQGDLVFATGTLDQTPHDGGSRALSESVRIGTGGARKASYGMFPGTESFFTGGWMGMVPFGARTTVTTVGNEFVVGTAVKTEIRIFGLGGALGRILRWPDRDRAVTDARFNAYVDEAVAEVPEAQQAKLRDRLNRMPRAGDEPPYWTVLADDRGQIWVGDYPGQESVVGLASPGRHWLVFGPNGAIRAKLETPSGFEVKSIRGSDIVGVYKNELGEESLRVYRIAGPRS